MQTQQVWGTNDSVRTLLEEEGHKHHFINTVVYYVHAQHDVYRLWTLRVILSDISDSLVDCTEDLYPLSTQQASILDQLIQCCDKRDENFAGALCDSEAPLTHNTRGRVAAGDQSERVCFQVIVGKPGMGKSQVLKQFIHACLMDKHSVAVATPPVSHAHLPSDHL